QQQQRIQPVPPDGQPQPAGKARRRPRRRLAQVRPPEHHHRDAPRPGRKPRRDHHQRPRRQARPVEHPGL
ncbi:hypothetical protein IWQ56_001566, partial [Coemansia nantahalensis]